MKARDPMEDLTSPTAAAEHLAKLSVGASSDKPDDRLLRAATEDRANEVAHAIASGAQRRGSVHYPS